MTNSVVDFRGSRKGENAPSPPHSIEIEQALLGAILLNNGSLDQVETLEPMHFFDPLHARIFETTCKVVRSGHLASPITLKAHFEKMEPIGEITVPQYLGRLVAHAAPTVGAGSCARQIIDLAQRRQMIVVADDLAARAPDPDTPASVILEETERQLYAIAGTAQADTRMMSLGEATTVAVARAEAAMSTGGASGISTGLIDLDRKTGGLQPSDLIIIAGRPAMGKSALAANIALAAAQDYEASGGTKGARALFFSLEMSADQIGNRLLSETAAVSSEKIRRGLITRDQLATIRETGKGMQSVPLWIDETGGQSIARIATKARRAQRQHGIGLIVIDYLQLMTGTTARVGGNRTQEITEITTGLKALAKDLNVPVVALSQLSRNLEGRDDKRPQLSDLRESGSIEQDADVVMFVYREEYYLARQEPPSTDYAKYSDWLAKYGASKGKAEIIIGKQRHGPVGKVDVAFDSDLTKFRNLAAEKGLRE